jgi:membrane protein DedA with SNARE-associated domain
MLLLWIYIEIDIETIAAVAKTSPIAKQLVQVWNWDVTKAAVLGAMMMPLTMFFAANMLKQKVDRCRGFAVEPENWFTSFGQNIANTIKTWRWTPVLIWLCLLSELFFTFQVGVTKATYVFLSWLNTMLADVSFGIVLILMFLVGNLMFLLPPVPGLPVYVFAGILIGEKGYQDPSIGLWGGCGIAIVLCLFTKLCACTGQYMIGYFLGQYVKVQQLIQVDKVGTRAVELIVKSKGLNLNKVSVLVGGPDWPVSVSCGIMKVNIPQMLLGTIPVLALMTPCVLAGACLGRVTLGEESMWGTWAKVFTALAALVNAAAGAYAVYAISETVKVHGEELAKPRPDHERVEALTAKEKAFNDKYDEVTSWGALTTYWRVVLCIGTAFLYWSNFFFVMLKERCFRPFAVSSKIDAGYDEDGLEGDVFSIILPMGGFFLVIFAIGVVLHIYVSKTFTWKAKVAMAETLKADTEKNEPEAEVVLSYF